MAGANPFLVKLRGVLQTLDDEALAGLANRGLLRRAQKDLEATKPTILSIDDASMRLQVAEAEVVVSELPAKSSCSCPSCGICRHILSALVYLRDDPGLSSADGALQGSLFNPNASDSTHPTGLAEIASAAEIFANLTDDEIQKWAGKALLRKAHKALAASPQVEIDTSKSLLVRFPARNITCRWIPSSGLLGMVCSCQAETVCEHVVAAVLAYQVSIGKRQLSFEQSSLQESAGAPRTRAEVLASVHTALCEMVSHGLARLSVSTVQRLTTLAISAHGVDLPRLERLLRSLADEVQLYLRRDAQSSSTSLLARAAQIEAVCTALDRHASSTLVGQHRTQYHEVGEINLVGVGAQYWRSKSGYQGVTVYFFDKSRSDWSTWTDARPANQPGFDPMSRFRADGPWPGCGSPEEASHGVVQLSGAWRNPQGRISGRGSTRALVTGKSDPLSLPLLITDWSLLADRVKQLFGGGLKERDARSQFVLLAPKAWGPGHYDSLRQELLRPVFDAAGRMLELWMPFFAEQQTAVEYLDKHDPAATHAVFGALQLVAGTIRVQPISLYVVDEIISLNLRQSSSAKPTRVSAAQPPNSAAELDSELDDVVEADLPPAASVTALGRLFVTAQAEIEAIAESGVAARRDWGLLKTATQRMEDLGLVVCARPLNQVLDGLAQPASLAEPTIRRQSGQELLHAYYVLQMAADREAMAIACAGLNS